MFQDTKAFSSFSTDDIEKTKEFYGKTLGLDIKDGEMGVLDLTLPGGGIVMIYPKENHEAASFTVLNFPVDDIVAAVKQLKDKGIKLEKYDMGEEFKPDENGIYRGSENGSGPDIAWFKDPSDNVIAVMAE